MFDFDGSYKLNIGGKKCSWYDRYTRIIFHTFFI